MRTHVNYLSVRVFLHLIMAFPFSEYVCDRDPDGEVYDRNIGNVYVVEFWRTFDLLSTSYDTDASILKGSFFGPFETVYCFISCSFLCHLCFAFLLLHNTSGCVVI